MNTHAFSHLKTTPFSTMELACWMIYVDLLVSKCGVQRLSINAQQWTV